MLESEIEVVLIENWFVLLLPIQIDLHPPTSVLRNQSVQHAQAVKSQVSTDDSWLHTLLLFQYCVHIVHCLHMICAMHIVHFNIWEINPSSTRASSQVSSVYRWYWCALQGNQMKCSGMHMDDVHCIYTQCSAGLESAFSCISACPRLICLWPNSAFEVSLLGLSWVLSGHALPTPLVCTVYMNVCTFLQYTDIYMHTILSEFTECSKKR